MTVEKIFKVRQDVRVRIVRTEAFMLDHPWDSGDKQSKITWWGESGPYEPANNKHVPRGEFDTMFCDEDRIILAIGLRKSDKDDGFQSDCYNGIEDNWAEGVLYIEVEDKKDRKKAAEILERDFLLLNAYYLENFFDVFIEERCNNPKCTSWHPLDKHFRIAWTGDDGQFWNDILPFLNEHFASEEIKSMRESFSMAE